MCATVDEVVDEVLRDRGARAGAPLRHRRRRAAPPRLGLSHRRPAVEASGGSLTHVPFDTSNLHRDEKIVLDLHPHWIMLVKGVVVLVVTIVIGIWVLTWDLSGTRRGRRPSDRRGAAIIASLLYMLQRWIAWISTNFVVTTDRCIYREGIVSKRGVEIPLERINTIFFNQSVIDRMIGAGTLTIESAGENGVQTFEDVRDPIGVQQVLYQEMEDNENRKFDRVRAPAATASVADELAKLATAPRAGPSERRASSRPRRPSCLGDAGQSPRPTSAAETRRPRAGRGGRTCQPGSSTPGSASATDAPAEPCAGESGPDARRATAQSRSTSSSSSGVDTSKSSRSEAWLCCISSPGLDQVARR